MKTVITVRLEPEVGCRLDRMARATARTKSYLIADAIEEYLTINELQVDAIQVGLHQADGGQVIPHEAIRAKWEARLADLTASWQ